MPKSNNSRNHHAVTVVWQCIISLLIITLLNYFLLCIAAKGICMMDVSSNWFIPMTTSFAAAAILLGIYISTRYLKAYCMLQALICAVLCWSSVVIVSCGNGQRIGEMAFLKLILFLTSAAVGGFLGKYLRENMKRHRHIR